MRVDSSGIHSAGDHRTGMDRGVNFGGSSDAQAYLIIALSFGLIMATLVQCFGHISGAHFNPVTTVAMALTCKITPLRGFFYAVAQLGGGIAGAALLYGNQQRLYYIFLLLGRRLTFDIVVYALIESFTSLDDNEIAGFCSVLSTKPHEFANMLLKSFGAVDAVAAVVLTTVALIAAVVATEVDDIENVAFVILLSLPPMSKMLLLLLLKSNDTENAAIVVVATAVVAIIFAPLQLLLLLFSLLQLLLPK
ncbi:big brain-like [Octopus vulgaris]|nr:big brain-like [Octopus vulgaris]